MANFLLYKYRFERAQTQDLFAREDASLGEERLNEMLGEALERTYRETAARSLNLFATVKNRQGEKEPELYDNEILHSSGGVTLMEIRNNKTKKVMPRASHEEEEVGHYPFCWVIIDTRPGSQAILVQQKSDAFGQTKLVCDLITDYVRRTFSLSELGWDITADMRICKGKIWDVVRTRLSGGHNRVKSLVIKFAGKNANPENEVDRALQLVLEKLASPEGELKLKSDDPAKKLLDETNEDLKQIIDMLIENQYRLTIGFEKGGTLEYGKNASAVYGIEDKVVEAFGTVVTFNENGERGFELTFWLDTIMPDDSAHEYISTNSKRRKRNGRNKKQSA